MTACSEDKQRSVTIREPRPLTTLDSQTTTQPQAAPPLANEDYRYTKPSNWTKQAPTSFRKLNFSFGSDGEAYLSESKGGILPNVNRWLNQFGANAISSKEELSTITILGHTGYLTTASGSFKGMNKANSQANYKLLGAIVEINGALITVKMTGPLEEVTKQESAFRGFCQSLQFNH